MGTIYSLIRSKGPSQDDIPSEETDPIDKDPGQNPGQDPDQDKSPPSETEDTGQSDQPTNEDPNNSLNMGLSGDIDQDFDLEAMRSDLEDKERAYEAGLAEYEASKSQLDMAYQEKKSKLDLASQELEAREAEYNAAMARIKDGENELENQRSSAKAELDAARSRLLTGQASYQAGLDEYYSGLSEFESQKSQAEAQLKEAYKELLSAREEVEESFDLFYEESEEASAQIDDARQETKDARDNVLSLSPPDYSIDSIDDNLGVHTYRTNSQRMDALSIVFPFFFYLVAMLVTLTTMRRMIDEQRSQIGTMKSLGYSNILISLKYYVYGLVPSLVGSILGSLLGVGILTKYIFDAYSSGFSIGGQLINLNIGLIGLTVLVSALLILITVHFTIKDTVNEVPAKLLRPEPPKSGSHIFLERIKPLWSRLSFMHKISARNIFRYKSRMFMTVFGVAGCTALIFFGFAMRGSIVQYPDLQFGQIMKFDLISIYDDKADEDIMAEYKNIISNEESTSALYQRAQLTIDGSQHNVNIIVPENPEDFDNFVSLRTRQGHDLDLNNEGVIITEKLARMDDIHIGDKIQIADDDGLIRNLNVAGITENYFNHYIYMSPAYYEDSFQDKHRTNADYIITDNYEEVEDRLLDSDAVLSIVNIGNIEFSASSLLDALDLVIVIIIAISSILSIVVLYNLTNVNVSERRKELATIKVLGFYPREVTAYVYRETLILTIIGILLGYLGGILLHKFILKIVPPEPVMLVKNILASTYIISAAITLIISALVMVIVHFKLKNIDMVEALKGTD